MPPVRRYEAQLRAGDTPRSHSHTRAPKLRLIRELFGGIAAFFSRTARATKIVVGHQRIPRPMRWLAAVGLLPIPGPFDEIVLLLVAGILFVFYRAELREAWMQADRHFANPSYGSLAK